MLGGDVVAGVLGVVVSVVLGGDVVAGVLGVVVSVVLGGDVVAEPLVQAVRAKKLSRSKILFMVTFVSVIGTECFGEF